MVTDSIVGIRGPDIDPTQLLGAYSSLSGLSSSEVNAIEFCEGEHLFRKLTGKRTGQLFCFYFGQ